MLGPVTSCGSSTLKVQEFSTSEMKRVQKDLKGLDLPKSVFIYTTGDAGKLELGERANFPLVLVCDESSRKETENKVRKLSSDQFPKEIEWRDSLCQLNQSNTFFPSHFIHQVFLIGDPDKVDGLFYRFVDEVKGIPSKTRQKFRKHFVTNHLSQLKHVIEGKDLITPQATKHSLLLPIQFVLDLRIVDAIRVLGHWPKDYVSFLKFMPKAIPDLIEYMYQERLLPELDKQDIEDLKKAYQLGLMYQLGTEVSVTDIEAAYTNTYRILGKINSSQFCKQRSALVSKPFSKPLHC